MAADPKDLFLPPAFSVADVDHEGILAPHLGIGLAHHDQTTHGSRVAVSVVDAAAIVQIREAVKRHCTTQGPSGRKQSAEGLDPFTILDYLSEKGSPSGNRTLVLTHTVLRELLRNDDTQNPQADGSHRESFGLRARQNEPATLDTSQRMRHSPAQLFMDWLHHKQNAIRIYPSLKEMLGAGEFNAAKGGIVIVDDPAFRAIDGLPQHYPVDGKYPPTPQHAGERSIHALCEAVGDYYATHYQTGKAFPIVGMDTELRQLGHELPHNHPGMAHPEAFSLNMIVSAMRQNGLLSTAQEESYYGMLTRGNEKKRHPDQHSHADTLRVREAAAYFAGTSPEKGAVVGG